MAQVRIEALAFSASGGRLVSIGGEGAPPPQDIGSGGGAQSTRVALWDWAAGELEAQSAGPTEQLCGVGFNRYSDDPNAIFTYGMRKPPRFWSLEPDGFIKMEGVTKGVGSDQDNVCATVLADGSMVSGTASGEVYQWRGNELFHVLAAHNGTVTALEALTEPGCLASAGADGGIR